MKKLAFTLAEILIVLVVIGVITAILLPVAIQSSPDENVMKFKKANATLGKAISELVNSEYYLNGDLGVKADGTLLSIDFNNEEETSANVKYFCETFANVLNVKYKNCHTTNTSHCGAVDLRYGTKFSNNYSDHTAVEITPELLENSKKELDNACKSYYGTSGSIIGSSGNTWEGSKIQIITTDNIYWWEVNPVSSFGLKEFNFRRFSSPEQIPANFPDENGFDAVYKIICIDVDGVPENATKDDCVNECPFGYAIRADGKILTGARADEWINKSVQKGDS